MNEQTTTRRFGNLDQCDQQHIENCVSVMTSEGVSDEEIERWIDRAVAALTEKSGTDRGLYDY